MGRVVQRRAIAAGQLLLDLLVGARCAGCGRAAQRSPCARCDALLSARPSSADAPWSGDCPELRALVLAAKLGSWRGGPAWFADRVVERLDLRDLDAVTWVPADPGRRASRGGCLPERCARRVARRVDRPAIALLRRTGGSSQRGLARDDRRRNVADAYALRPQAPRLLPRGARVLLLDDVRTTGATLDAARRRLEEAGLRVRCVALVDVDRGRAAAGLGEPPVSTRRERVAETPQRARKSRSRRGAPVPIRWDHVRRKGSTRT